MEQDCSLTIRLPSSYRQRLEVVQAEMSKRLSGVKLKWSQVVRLALERGAETIEKELGLRQ